jgi:serine/threonine protein kinase
MMQSVVCIAFERLKVLKNTSLAHKSLFSVYILHRDISEGNILIDLSTGRGLLIDLDMAEDLQIIILATQEPANLPAMTASVAYFITMFVSSHLTGHIAIYVAGLAETAYT